MKVQIVGVGIVGGAQAYLASQLGNEVFGYDRKLTDFPYARMGKQLETDVDLTFICTPEVTVPEVIENFDGRSSERVIRHKKHGPPKTTRNLMDK